MKKLPLIAVIAACLMTSCATSPTPESIARIARGVKEAARQTTEEMLVLKPEWRDEFKEAHDELVILENAPTLSVDDILRIIQRLPVKELKSDEVRIAIRGARIIIAFTGWSEIDAERLSQLRPIVTALRQGLEEGGLGQ